MPPAFDLRQLRYFVAVAEAGSFRAAAERLHISQPPLSRQVADLERALGARLFERRPSGVELTPAGRDALPRAEAILRQAQELAQAPAHAVPGAAMRIGLTAAIAVADRVRLAQAWKRGLPHIPLEVTAGFTRDLVPALRARRLHFALVGLPGDVSGLETREVSSSPLVAALPGRHRLARRKRVSLLEVADLPLFWIARASSPDYHDFCRRYFRAIGYRPRTILVEPGLMQTFERIAAGEGWTIANGSSIETRVRAVAYRPLAEGADLAVRVAAAWRGPDTEGRFARLAAIAARILRPGSPSRRAPGRRA
jgi:DNA-binding transcriptional LysR family regulator